MNKIKLTVPQGVTSASFEGEQYDAVDGFVEVPAAAALQLYGFGFGNAPAEAAPQPKGKAASKPASDPVAG